MTTYKVHEQILRTIANLTGCYTSHVGFARAICGQPKLTCALDERLVKIPKAPQIPGFCADAKRMDAGFFTPAPQKTWRFSFLFLWFFGVELARAHQIAQKKRFPFDAPKKHEIRPFDPAPKTQKKSRGSCGLLLGYLADRIRSRNLKTSPDTSTLRPLEE